MFHRFVYNYLHFKQEVQGINEKREIRATLQNYFIIPILALKHKFLKIPILSSHSVIYVFNYNKYLPHIIPEDPFFYCLYTAVVSYGPWTEEWMNIDNIFILAKLF